MAAQTDRPRGAANRPSPQAERFLKDMERRLRLGGQRTMANFAWLRANMPPYFFITMREEVDSLLNLAACLDQVPKQSKFTLLDQDRKLLIARQDVPGSLYATLRGLQERSISYAEMTHAVAPMPGSPHVLEVQKLEFDLKSPQDIAMAPAPALPRGLRRRVAEVMKTIYPDFDFSELEKLLCLLWLNSESYVRVSPPERVARLLWLYQQGRRHGGLFLDVEKLKTGPEPRESRLVFVVGNPPKSGFLAQAMEVFARLDIGVRRFYSLALTTEHHSYFMGNFYVIAHDNKPIFRGSERFNQLKTELYHTQILSSASPAYGRFVPSRVMTGEEASLVNAFIAFCHTSLSHNQPDRFDREEVENAFLSQPDLALLFVKLFRTRFQPGLKGREKLYEPLLAEASAAVENFNTGHHRLDEVRKAIYHACLSFIRHTLKTNFFVPEKHALAFRLNPAYLADLGPAATADLPAAAPFRITFFFGRHGVGYHVGLSDIARGGWRTVICRSQDEYITNTNNLFREVFVLAHTQHLKNKDIYEGGSKLVVAVDAVDLDHADAVNERLYKVQYGFINAFLDLFITENGKAKDPRVVDYYGDDEPIEIGPDENMHDAMIEQIATLSARRGYVLGVGIMSSKSMGINHKEYGVTSRGVMRFAATAMRQVGIDIQKDPFSLRMTGGPFGDVAGNALKLILANCPQARILAIIDGTGALYDPLGADHVELSRHLLKNDIALFSPRALSPGGYLLYRDERRHEALRELYKKVARTADGLVEHWITLDEFQKELANLLFATPSDLFLPCGGRPETIDGSNWRKFFDAAGRSSARVIVEGANSFITPEARAEIQKRGVILLRDASANKCGVISSSYEIIANLLMNKKEFLKNKEAYVADVLAILEKRSEDEANLIFKRHQEQAGARLYTDISNELSTEINEHYARLFDFFQARPDLVDQPLYRKVLLSHLPAFIRGRSKYRARVDGLPQKIKCAILACEIATLIVYRGGWDSDLEGRLKGYLRPVFG